MATSKLTSPWSFVSLSSSWEEFGVCLSPRNCPNYTFKFNNPFLSTLNIFFFLCSYYTFFPVGASPPNPLTGGVRVCCHEDRSTEVSQADCPLLFALQGTWCVPALCVWVCTAWGAECCLSWGSLGGHQEHAGSRADTETLAPAPLTPQLTTGKKAAGSPPAGDGFCSPFVISLQQGLSWDIWWWRIPGLLWP